MIIRALLLAAIFFATPVVAQVPSKQNAGEIRSKPICTAMINRSDQTIMGTISTMPQRLADGAMAAHKDNFTLKSGERREFCASGPFFQGQRLSLTLRTIIPLFSCYTKIDREIFLDAKEEDGFKKLSATCY